MSLSDTCFDAIGDLTLAFHQYLLWSYEMEHMGKLAAVILELAELAYTVHYLPEAAEAFEKMHGQRKSPKLIAECVVVADLMTDPANQEVYEEAIRAVGLIGQVNAKVHCAIVNSYRWQQSPAGMSEMLRMENPISFEPVYRLICPDYSTLG